MPCNRQKNKSTCRINAIGHFRKYHKTPCLSLQILHKALFPVSLGTIVNPKRKQKQNLEGQTKRILVFSKVAHLSAFVKKGEINDHIALTNQTYHEVYVQANKWILF